MSEPGQRRMGVGASSLLMILVILCLTTLGVLSLTSALAEYRLSSRAAQTAAAYYEASANAQEKIAQIDRILADIRKESANSGEYAANITESGLKFANTDQSLVEISEPLGDGRVLTVRLQILPYESAKRYRVAEYAVIDEREWTQETWDSLIQ